MKRALLGGLAALTLAVSGLVATGGGATAATATAPAPAAEGKITPIAGEPGLYRITGSDVGILAWNNCQDGQTCFFQNSNGEGILWVVPSCWKNKVPSAFDNRASSVWNRGGGPVAVYYNTDWTGYLTTYGRWWQGNIALEHNDRISSVDVLCQ
ncbi:peptidase inhibitor family I36 protein [Streptomyces sp. NPDC058746]|uniref:peptidase inhibitor family I36 protein n=1 Tax=Streptomyces sp. NPDC058746 TaxID=3346622 RepID=UPI003679D7A5